MVYNLFKKTINYTAFRTNAILGYEKKVFLFGDGRSGTTWVSSLINYDSYFREIFEPFHPEFIPEVNFLSLHTYVRPNDINLNLKHVSDFVFKGRLWNPRIDQDNIPAIYQGLFVKDIFSNLFCL